jgi:hypothetical protein
MLRSCFWASKKPRDVCSMLLVYPCYIVHGETAYLEHHRERVAGLERRIGEDTIEKRGAVAVRGGGELRGQVSIKGLRQR